MPVHGHKYGGKSTQRVRPPDGSTGPTVRYWRFVNRIVEVTLLRAGRVCRLIFWVALRVHAVTGNRARRCGKFSPGQILVYLEYIFDIVFSTSRHGTTETRNFFETLHAWDYAGGRTTCRHKFVKRATNWITLRSDYHNEVSDSMTSFYRVNMAAVWNGLRVDQRGPL